MIGMRAAFRLRHDAVDAAQLAQVAGGDFHRLGSQILLARIAPHDRRTTFGGGPRAHRPLPPPPMTRATTGTPTRSMSRRLAAFASPCPHSSAPSPGCAPSVSTNVKI